MRYGTQGPERIPFLMQVIEGTQNAGGGSEVSEMFYGFDAADQGHEKVEIEIFFWEIHLTHFRIENPVFR